MQDLNSLPAFEISDQNKTKVEEEEVVCVSPEPRERIPEERSPSDNTIGFNSEKISQTKDFEKKMLNYSFYTNHQRKLSNGQIKIAGDMTTKAKANSIDDFPSNNNETLTRGKTLNPGKNRKRSTFFQMVHPQELTKEENENLTTGIIKLHSVEKGFRMSQKKMISEESLKKADEKIRRGSLTHVRDDKPKMARTMTESHLTQRQSSVKPTNFCKRFVKSVEEGTLYIEVTDTGCGMSEADKEQLFKPFSQANKAVHSKFGGTGLGLWLCQKLVTAMKGTIICNSTLGKGTTFKITLPLKCKSISPGDQESSLLPQTEFTGLQVLCHLKNVDDFEHKLKKLGCQVTAHTKVEDLLCNLRVYILPYNS